MPNILNSINYKDDDYLNQANPVSEINFNNQ